MKYSFKILNCFKKQLKAHLKKFPNLKLDLILFLENLTKKEIEKDLKNAINELK